MRTSGSVAAPVAVARVHAVEPTLAHLPLERLPGQIQPQVLLKYVHPESAPDIQTPTGSE